MGRSDDNLRRGYTTGSCATAATRAALLAVIRQGPVGRVAILLPGGERVGFTPSRLTWDDTAGEAGIIKDAGDDPDVTHGAEICAQVGWSDEPGVAFLRGPGVGLVTRPGLPVPPGEPAINPVPRRMIEQTVREVLDAERIERGVTVQISVPGGETIAAKTFNPRLGIESGISILGTAGIVTPYSTAAWRASVFQGIDVAVAQSCTHIVMTVGARGEKLARRWVPLPEIACVQIGPFFGEALQHAAEAGIEHVSLVSMIGKLGKFAAGHGSVHSGRSDQDFQFLAGLAREAGADAALIEEMLNANTAQQVAQIAAGAELDGFFQRLCDRAHAFATTFIEGHCSLDVLLIASDGDLLARTGSPPGD